MKKNLKIFLLIAVCVITGCCLLYIREENEKQQIHSEKQAKETLVFLTSKRETRHIFEKIIDDFNESQDDIYVEHLEVPNPDQELQIRAVQGNFPDIVEFIGAQKDDLEKYVKGGYLQALDDFSATHCVNEHFLEKLKILNGTYVLPLSVNYRGIFYNRRMLEEEGYQIPSTYAELINTMQQIKKSGKLPIVFADKDSWTIHQGWDAIDMSSRGSQDDLFQKVLNGDTFLYEDPIALDSTRKFLEIRKYSQKQTINTGYDEAVKTFANGEAYMFLQGNWAYPMIKKINPDIDLLFMPFPAYSENQSKVVVKIDATLGVSASCMHSEAVEQFLNYVFSKDVSEYYAEKAGAYSCIKSVDVADSYAKAFTDSIHKGEFFLEEFAYESEKSEARDALFQNFISSPQRNTETSFLKELNDLLILMKGD